MKSVLSRRGIPPPRKSLVRLPGFIQLGVVTAAAFTGYFFPLSVAPLWAVEGGAGERGAGMVTAALLLTTVATQPLVPAMLARFGAGPTLAAGLIFLGLPAPLYALSADLPPLLAVSAARGIGFGILTVSGSSVVAALSPAERRGEAIGLYGLTVALPQLIFLPLGVLLARQVGFAWVFVLSAAPLLGIPAAVALGRRGSNHFRRARRSRAKEAPAGEAGAVEVAPDLPEGRSATGEEQVTRPRPNWWVVASVLVPSLILAAVTMAGGGLTTFIPIAFESARLASVSLLVMGAVAALTRWRVGRLADAYGVRQLMWPALVAGTLGAAGTVWAVADARFSYLIVPAILIFGVGYGAVQNLTLISAFARAGPRYFGVASAAWNIGFDLGTAAGALVLGVVAQAASFTVAFAVGAAVVAACLPVAMLASRDSEVRRDVGS